MALSGLKEESDRDCLGACHGAPSLGLTYTGVLHDWPVSRGLTVGRPGAVLPWGGLTWLCLSFLVCPVGGALVPTSSVLETALSAAHWKGSMAACMSLS